MGWEHFGDPEITMTVNIWGTLNREVPLEFTQAESLSKAE